MDSRHDCEEIELDTIATSLNEDELTPSIPDRHFFFSSNADNSRKNHMVEMTTFAIGADLNQVPMGEGIYHQFPPYRGKKLTEHVAESIEIATKKIDKAADKVAGLVGNYIKPKG